LEDYAIKHDLEFGPPYYALIHPMNNPSTPATSRAAIISAQGQKGLAILSDLQLAQVEFDERSQFPFTKPDNFCILVRSDQGQYEVYPTGGTAWEFHNPENTRSYTVQPGVSVRKVIYETLVQSSPEKSSSWNVSATRNHTPGLYPGSEALSEQQREEYRQQFRPVLEGITNRSQWYDLRSMLKSGETALAVDFVTLDYQSVLSKTLPGLQEQGWKCCKVSLTRDLTGLMSGQVCNEAMTSVQTAG
jgi:hypothetical protein